MTETTAVKKEMQAAQFSVDPETGLVTANIGDAKVEVSADGKTVTAYTKDGVSQEVAAASAAVEGAKISLSKDFSAAVLNGVTIKQAADGHLIIAAAEGTVVINKPVPANDDAAAQADLILGQQTADGVYAGPTADGKQQIYAMPEDLDVTMTFNDAAKAVKKLNSQKVLGHDDWQIGNLEVTRILQKNQNEGALKGTFKTAASSGSGFPDWYWSSTEDRDGPSYVHGVRFSDGDEDWGHKDIIRLSCRPVRLVATSSAPAPG